MKNGEDNSNGVLLYRRIGSPDFIAPASLSPSSTLRPKYFDCTLQWYEILCFSVSLSLFVYGSHLRLFTNHTSLISTVLFVNFPSRLRSSIYFFCSFFGGYACLECIFVLLLSMPIQLTS